MATAQTTAQTTGGGGGRGGRGRGGGGHHHHQQDFMIFPHVDSRLYWYMALTLAQNGFHLMRGRKSLSHSKYYQKKLS